MNSTVLLFDIWLRYFECMSLWCLFYYKIFKLVQHGTEYSVSSSSFLLFFMIKFVDFTLIWGINITPRKKLLLFRLLQL